MIDSHIHLTDKSYKEDIDIIMKEAFEEGVETMLVIGCDAKEIEKTIPFIKKYDVYGAIGFHPVEFKNYEEKDLIELEEKLNEDRIVALGEIGLDYHWYPNDKKEQEKLLRLQMEIAKKKNIPVIIHSREALEDTYNILKDYKPLKGVIHSFSGTSEEAKKYIDLGLLIGLTGPITFKNGENQREVAKEVSLKNLLIETDGPFLTPVPFRGKRNKPQYIRYVAEEIAIQKKCDIEEVIKETSNNFKRVFLGGK